MKSQIPLLVALLISVAAFAEGPNPKEVAPPTEDHWKFMLSVPGWMPSVGGTVGIDGIDSNVDLRFKGMVNHIDMLWSTRAEASRDRFGVMGELIYLSMSDSVGVGGMLRNVDVRLDQYLADLSFRWRLLEGPKGYIDAEAGVRYTNIFQHLHLQSDDAGIGTASVGLVNDVDDVIRERLNGVLSDDEFRHQVTKAVDRRVVNELEDTLGPNPKRRLLAIGPIAARHPQRVAELIADIMREEESRLRAEINAISANASNRAAEVQRRIAATEGRMEKRIADVLKKELNRSFSRDDDWWDPYIGVRARYNFTPAIYVIGRADIGGFGVGSDLMWQLEGAVGVQLTRMVFAEAGYRALSFDYDKGGFKYDTITHGAQVTFGVAF